MDGFRFGYIFVFLFVTAITSAALAIWSPLPIWLALPLGLAAGIMATSMSVPVDRRIADKALAEADPACHRTSIATFLYGQPVLGKAFEEAILEKKVTMGGPSPLARPTCAELPQIGDSPPT